MSRLRFSILFALLAAFVFLTSQAKASISISEPSAQFNKFDFQSHLIGRSSSTQDGVAGCVDSSNPTGPGQNINIDSASHPNPWAGLIWVRIPQDSPTKTPTFCTDLVTGISAGDCFQTDNNNPLTACPITWLLNNDYGPDDNESNAENAARQAAVWHFSDGVNVLSSDPVYARTQAIINAVPQPCELPSEPPVMAIDPPSAINFLPGGESHTLTVSVTQDGSPVTNQDVDLSTDFGTLNTNSVTTNASGEATFTIESATTGTANITASFPYQLPSGTRFTKLDGAEDQQVIVLGSPEDSEVSATATKTWEEGTLIIAHKFNDSNTNGVQNSGEENLSGWEMTLQISDGQGGWTDVDSGNTDQNGNVIFNGLAPDTYRVVETQQSGWEATTPNPSNSVTLAAGEQAVIDFGNVPLAVIKAYKFHDLNGDGIRQDNEPLLDGWTMNINPAGNGIGEGDTVDGSVSFIDLEPGTYTVWETQQDGWCATTDDSMDVTVGPNEFAEVWFGNHHCPVDWGDLPDSFDTTNTNNGPYHTITSDLYLGSCVDAETDGQPDAQAGNAGGGSGNGDDGNAGSIVGTCSNDDDEDGVTLVTPLIPGAEACVEIDAVNSGVDATLYGWIDFNGDGNFDGDINEKLTFTSGNTVFGGGAADQEACFTVPAEATFDGGETHMRFRLTRDTLSGGKPWLGAASDGEVEDYWEPLACVGNYLWMDTGPDLNVQDAGDTPVDDGTAVNLIWGGPDGIIGTGDDNTYSTTTTDGVYHFCGLMADPNANGNPDDDPYQVVVPTLPDTPVTPDDTDDIHDSDCDLSGEMSEFTLPDPVTTLPINEDGNSDNPGGLNNYPDNQDDLTFDCGFKAPVYDFGDAPDNSGPGPYPNQTLLPNGARHLLNSTLVLGTCVDSELDGSPVLAAQSAMDPNPAADDMKNGSMSPFLSNAPDTCDDEDGMGTVDQYWNDGGTIEVIVSGVPNEGACVYGWIDWDRNGFDANDAIDNVDFTIPGAGPFSDDLEFSNDPPGAGNFPEDGLPVYIRLRVVPGACGQLEPTGLATGGEVEDHNIATTPTAIDLRTLPKGLPVADQVWILVAVFVLLVVTVVTLQRRRQHS